MLLFYFVKAFSTIMNNGSITFLITEAYPTLAICLLIELGIKNKSKQLIEAFTTVLGILTLINFITMIVDPDGYHVKEKVLFFMRHRNQLAPLYILTVVMMDLRNNYFQSKNSKIQLILTFIISTFMIFHAGSGSNIIAWIPIIIYFFLPFLLKKTVILNIRSYLLFYVILFFSVVLFNIQERYAGLLYRILRRDATFSGRIQLWNIAIEMIKNRPLIGYGMAESVNIIYSPTKEVYYSTHNQFMQLLIEGGFISLLVFCGIAYLAFNKLYEYRNSEASKILSIGIFSIALVLFSEAMGFFDFLILFAFAFNIDKIVNTSVISMSQKKI